MDEPRTPKLHHMESSWHVWRPPLDQANPLATLRLRISRAQTATTVITKCVPNDVLNNNSVQTSYCTVYYGDVEIMSYKALIVIFVFPRFVQQQCLL